MNLNPDDEPKDLHTEADDEAPLSAKEADAMGFQVPRQIPGHRLSAETVYGEMDGVENEDQYDAHHADPDQHL